MEEAMCFVLFTHLGNTTKTSLVLYFANSPTISFLSDWKLMLSDFVNQWRIGYWKTPCKRVYLDEYLDSGILDKINWKNMDILRWLIVEMQAFNRKSKVENTHFLNKYCNQINYTIF